MPFSPDFAELAEFARAFPFHLVISPTMAIQGVGEGLARLDPALRGGSLLTEHFDWRDSAQPLSWALLNAAPQADFCLAHRKTGLELRGRMVITAGGGPAVFLGRSWLDDAEQLADFGLSLDELNSAAKDGSRSPKPGSEVDFPALPTAGPTAGTVGSASDWMARCAQLERCLRLHQTVTRCLAETNDVAVALRLLSETLPASLGWPGAILWHQDAEGRAIAEPAGAPSGLSPAAAAGLASGTFQSGAPAWSADGCAGRGGFALPVNSAEGTVAVITCVSHQAEPDDDELVRQLYLSAGQLARYVARQQQKERLTRLTSELTAIFQLSPDGFVAFNSQGTLSYLNPTFARLTGVERDDLRGLSEPEFERRLATLLDQDQPARPASNGDSIIRLRQPRLTLLQRSQRDARDIEGRLVGRLLYFRDITLETELLRANGEFLANAAHELRTPMASIHGFAELLLKREFEAEPRRKILQTIHSQSSRLSEIVDELLEVARFDARAARDLHLSPQPLLPVITATVGELLIRNDSRPVTLLLPAVADSPTVRIDRDRFVQALTNVLSNAYKYSPAGGAIELRLLTRTRSDLPWVGVAVRDHGIGMNQEELGHLFERFFRAHPSGNIPGTGLGMSMVKKIIDAHGGTVEVESAPGQGTELTLWLPIDQPACGSPAGGRRN